MRQKLITLLVLAVFVTGCAAGRAFRRGQDAARSGDWDLAVVEYTKAVQANPDKTEYKIQLERASQMAATVHVSRARDFEEKDNLDAALMEYRRATELDSSNRIAMTKVTEIEKKIRDRIEATRPKPRIDTLRDQARALGQPVIDLTTRLPSLKFQNASLRDILNFIATQSGINITFDQGYRDRGYSIVLEDVTVEQALQQIMLANQLFYKVLNPKTILVIEDNAQNHAKYDELVVRVFYISHADIAELTQIINSMTRIATMPVQPAVLQGKSTNTITVRGTVATVEIIEKMIRALDRPRAEVVVDVQILEVNRGRAKQFGIDLSEFAIYVVFSPETDPRGTTDGAATLTPQPFNLNSITRGISAADFYLSVPSAVVQFLETDTESRLIAKPQLRGAEGQQITLNLGDEIPVPATVFTPVAQGGANFNPLTSFNYRPVGVNIQVTPRVTFEGDIILDLLVESSTLGQDVNIAGQNLPSFGSRKVQTRLRMRDGESNLLAGLLREEDRRSLRGIPGLLRLPVLRSIFASNDTEIRQTDIIMLLTPRIVRTQELTFQDVSPIFIGSQQSLGLAGPPPLIVGEPPPGVQEVPAPLVPVAPTPVVPIPGAPNVGQPGAPGPGGVPVVPPGSSQVPGTTTVPSAPAQPEAVAPTVPVPGGVPGAPAGGAPPGFTTAPGGGQIVLSPPGPEFLVGGGPYTVPVSIVGASQISSVTLTITFNPSTLRVRAVQEGSFMRTGGVAATFTQQVDGGTGRIDIAVVRTGDQTGVAGTGLLSAVLFDAVGGGPANFAVTGAATDPRGMPVPLQFGLATPVVVK